MKNKLKRITAALSSAVIAASVSLPAAVTTGGMSANAASKMMLEYLDRGICAINTGSGMLVSWRYLANDDDNATYKLYRDGTLIYTSESGKSTCYLDSSGNANSKYRVDTLSGNTLVSSEDCKLISNNAYFDVPLSPPTASGVTYSPNDISVGDVDGDGQYELFLKWDPDNSKDNSQKGKTGNVFIDCVRLDGTRLWRIDLGQNIRAGAHYTQFFVGDFDLDGKAEMTCKTADGTKDGKGTVIGDSSKDYRNSNGYVLSGPEYYTLFDGATGAALDTIDYKPGRGTVKNWGDSYGGRVDRFWGTVAYLDGVHPCIVTGRGYYTRLTATAYTVENKKLKELWAFDTGNSSSTAGYGDGNHNSMPADVDGDGKQEIITGAAVIDDNGKLYYTTGQGHGDALHIGDLDPTNPGLESWICHEEKKSGYGVSLIDLDQKKIIYHQNGAGDTGRCCADNVWAGNPGAECWGNKLSDNSTPVVDTKGNVLNCRRPAINFLSYWDGDLEREILDACDSEPNVGVSQNKGNALITKISADGKGLTTLLQTKGYYVCNTTKATPCLSADIFGDWREELIVRAANHQSVRIYCTPYDTDYRITTLMHDAQYRMQVSAQQTGYNQPPHPSFFLGTGYDLPARPTNCEVNGGEFVPIGKTGAVIDTAHKYIIKNVNSGLYLEVADGKAENGSNVQQGNLVQGWTFEDAGDGYYRLYSELGDGKTYLLDIDYGKTDNGTNIGIWGNTNSDAQLFKFVDNGNGTYNICTKVTNDNSGIGVTAASKDAGANVVEWACNDSDDQKWTIEIKIDPIEGNIFKNVIVNDTENYQDWQVETSVSSNGKVYGDREFTYTSLPDVINGAESILTACDSKNYKGNLVTFIAGCDMEAYVLLDKRVEDNNFVPAWLGEWTRTDMTAVSSNDVTFVLYENTFKEGQTVTLGDNGTNVSVINYTVFGKALEETVTTTEVTTTTTTENVTTADITTAPDTETTTAVSADILYGDANCDDKVSISDAVAILQYLANSTTFPLSDKGMNNADVYKRGDGVTGQDASAIQRYDAGVLTSLPESYQ